MLTFFAALFAVSTTVAVGQPAPPFDLPSDHGGRVNLADLAGKKVVLAFYPKAFTPG